MVEHELRVIKIEPKVFQDSNGRLQYTNGLVTRSVSTRAWEESRRRIDWFNNCFLVINEAYERLGGVGIFEIAGSTSVYAAELGSDLDIQLLTPPEADSVEQRKILGEVIEKANQPNFYVHILAAQTKDAGPFPLPPISANMVNGKVMYI